MSGLRLDFGQPSHGSPHALGGFRGAVALMGQSPRGAFVVGLQEEDLRAPAISVVAWALVVGWGQSARAGRFPWRCGFDGTVPAVGFRGRIAEEDYGAAMI